jgi:tRNA-dependent cyclodipeptide synthase
MGHCLKGVEMKQNYLTLSADKFRRASIAKVLPDTVNLQQHRRAVLAISLNNDNYTSEKLAAMIAMANSRFDECTLLVGDSVYRLTLCLRECIPEDEARERSSLMGKRYVKENASLIAQQCGISFLLSSDLWVEPGVCAVYAGLLDIYKDNAVFRASVQAFAESYCRRIGVTPGTGLCRAQQYLLEELALFSHLVTQGRGLVLYAGNIQTVADIAAGACGDMRNLFAGLAFGSIRFKSSTPVSIHSAIQTRTTMPALQDAIVKPDRSIAFE